MRDADPAKTIALMALEPRDTDSGTLEAVLRYCWDQLTWRMGDTQLLAIVDELRLSLDEVV